MEEAFTIDYNETLLLSVAGGLFLIQVIYYASLYLRIPRRRKAVEQGDIAFQTDCPPLSVILYAREACEELKRNLPALLAQDYPTFEVIVITDFAQKPEEIDIERAERAKVRAEERLREKESQIEFARSQAELARAMARLKVAKRKRNGRS